MTLLPQAHEQAAKNTRTAAGVAAVDNLDMGQPNCLAELDKMALEAHQCIQARL
jgi:hypothetical protein